VSADSRVFNKFISLFTAGAVACETTAASGDPYRLCRREMEVNRSALQVFYLWILASGGQATVRQVSTDKRYLRS